MHKFQAGNSIRDQKNVVSSNIRFLYGLIVEMEPTGSNYTEPSMKQNNHLTSFERLPGSGTIFSFLLLFLLLQCNSSNNMKTKSMTSLKDIATADWAGKTVQNVLDSVQRKYDDHIFVDNKPGSLTATGFRFGEEGWLYVYVTDYKFQPRFNIERNWDLEAFKKETVSRVEFEEN
jgi:hypothetical protein